MKTKEEIMTIIKEQLSLEYNCFTNDFSKSENIITTIENNNGRRLYKDEHFFKMVTLGNNAVISSEECIQNWLKNFVKEKKGYHLFEHHNLMVIENELKKYNKSLRQSFHFFISYNSIEFKRTGLKIKWFEKDSLKEFYGKKLFENNAISIEPNENRPDVLAVAAYDDNKIIGIAGCSADTPILWQIGIDVDEKYREKGIGTYLVLVLKKEIEKRNKIPFYATSLSNIFSWKIALKCGFSPTWIEIDSV
jgi:GNAT superfamily N-acetyltransferase